MNNTLTWVDILAFMSFFALVVGISLYKSREENTSADYFLASRGLGLWLIGFSLIASNISSEHFVGMAGAGFGSLGLAVASYEWIAAITLVFVALFLLPRFLRSGIYTIPEFLEYRYNAASRAIMAIFIMIMYVAVALASILYAGALGLQTIFGMNLSLLAAFLSISRCFRGSFHQESSRYLYFWSHSAESAIVSGHHGTPGQYCDLWNAALAAARCCFSQP